MTELVETEAQPEKEPLDDVDAAERLPAEIEPAILRKYFNLTRADLDEVERCRGPANKLGFSVQLCTLRWRGHFLPDTRDLPATVLEVLSPQLGLLPMLLADYPRDEKTRFAISSASAVTSALGVAIVLSGSTCLPTSAPLPAVRRVRSPYVRPHTSGCSNNTSFGLDAQRCVTWSRLPEKPACSKRMTHSRAI